MTQRHYGWRPQLPDQRDSVLPTKFAGKLSPTIDLTTQLPPLTDQGQLGSCVANGVAFSVRHQRRLKGLTDFAPSRLAIYYAGRKMESTPTFDATKVDTGLYIRDGFKAVNLLGVASEDEPQQKGRWVYDIAKFAKAPTADVTFAEAHHKVLQYDAVPQSLVGIQTALHLNRLVTFGFTVYESFESEAVAQTGIVPMPQPGERVLGGHCIDIVAVDMSEQRVKCANWWGEGFGDHGFVYLPFSFILSPALCSDFWCIALVGT